MHDSKTLGVCGDLYQRTFDTRRASCVPTIYKDRPLGSECFTKDEVFHIKIMWKVISQDTSEINSDLQLTGEVT